MTHEREDAAGARSRRPGGEAPFGDVREVREFLTRSWSELLRCSRLDEHSDFRARGGDSLLMTRLVRRVHAEFGVAVSLHDMSRRNLGDQVALVHGLRSEVRPESWSRSAGLREVRTFVDRVWGELLGCTELTWRSDFFALGGDSLLMTRLARRIDKEYGLKMPVHDLLAAATLGEQALLVRRRLTDAAHASRRRRRVA